MHFILSFLFKLIQPLLAEEDIPSLHVFYPTEDWYKEQKLLDSFSTDKVKLKLPLGVPLGLLTRIVLWEFKPGKIISISFIFLAVFIICKPLLPREVYVSLILASFLVFALTTCCGGGNLITAAEYLVYEARNRFLIKKFYRSHTNYHSFINAYHHTSFYKFNGRIASAIATVTWLLVLAGIISASILAWR